MDDQSLVANAVRQRLSAVGSVCIALASTVGPFRDPDQVFRDLAQMRSQIDLCRQSMIRSGVVRP
jgi:hypothetical protein